MISPLILKRIPDPQWVKNLRINDLIWLAKEQHFAIINERYRSMDSDGYSHVGKIVLRRLAGPRHGSGTLTAAGTQETWLVRENGQGIDYSQIIMPVMEVGQSYTSKEIELLLLQIQQDLASISQRLTVLEDAVTAGMRPPRPALVKHTNGYCDTCGDMYVKGYEGCHPKCQKENV
jgi:hypothetical protein